MIQLIGRLHPLLVHLPIGILLLAYLMECLSRFGKRSELTPSIRRALQLGLFSAFLSAGSGWILAGEGGYADSMLEFHRYLGLLAVALYALTRFLDASVWYFPVFTAATLALVATGHFGGGLTHGAGFLYPAAEKTTADTAPVSSDLGPDTHVFNALILPILQKKCVSCHRVDKHKGDLILENEAGIRRGGKHGQVLVAGRPDSSNMLRRIFLPSHHDDHMPPTGKPQLTDMEIKLLEWWIHAGEGLFQVTLKDHPLPEEIKSALSARSGAYDNPLFLEKVEPASREAIKALQQLGFRVQLRSAAEPWLIIAGTGQRSLRSAHWEALEKIAPQLIDLDLSHSNAADEQLNGRVFPHLQRLNLAYSQVGNGILPLLQKTPFLESLNLTGTQVDDAIGALLPNLKHLKGLYVWESKVTGQQISAWKNIYRTLVIETGSPAPDSNQLVLRAPAILHSRTFFDDTMHVDLSFPFRGVEIFYTLDEASTPSKQSPKYTQTIVLDKSAHLRAFAAKEGWQDSPLADTWFMRKKYPIKDIKLLHPPSPKYSGKGGGSLTDGIIGADKDAGTWLGYEGEHMDMILDLGEEKELRTVYVHALEQNIAWIHRPLWISVAGSRDGEHFKPCGRMDLPPSTSLGEPKAQLIGCPLTQPVSARYWKVHVQSVLKNPDWHPGKGNKSWIFVDEVTVD